MEQIEHICPRYRRTIELVGKRWSGAVIRALMDGPRRFGELLEAVPGLHDRLLSQRLKELEGAGIVRRRVYPEIPVRVEYELTAKGHDLQRVVAEVQRWANRWLPAPARAPARTRPAPRRRSGVANAGVKQAVEQIHQ